MIAQLGEKAWGAGPEGVESEPGFYQVYPPDSELKGIESAEDMSRRRYAMSSFLGYSDNRRVALVERQEGRLWLVALNVEIRGGLIRAGHERIPLPLSGEEIYQWMAEDLSWRKPDEELSFVFKDRRWVVNLLRKTVGWEIAQ